MNRISPSKLAIQASHQHPIGIPAENAGRCVMCGYEFDAATPIVEATFPDTFTNHSDFRYPNGSHVCGYCVAVRQDPWLQAWMNSVITEDGVYQFSRNADIAYWLLNPPEGRFIMMKGDQKQQHLVWRAPVNFNREIYQVRFGEKVISIRRKHLIQAKEACQTISKALLATQNAKAGRKPDRQFISPFSSVAREMDSLLAGSMRQEVLRLADASPEIAEHVTTLNSCTPGEIWGLTAILYADPSEKPTPQIIKTSIETSKEQA